MVTWSTPKKNKGMQLTQINQMISQGLIFLLYILYIYFNGSWKINKISGRSWGQQTLIINSEDGDHMKF